MKPPIKAADIFIIFLVTGITFYLAYNVYLVPQGNVQVLIRGQGSEWTFPVDSEEIITVSGPLGDTIVKIENNQTWVEKSPCFNQTCVASGVITRQGQWAACLPNNVLLMIQGGGTDEIDAVSW